MEFSKVLPRKREIHSRILCLLNSEKVLSNGWRMRRAILDKFSPFSILWFSWCRYGLWDLKNMHFSCICLGSQAQVIFSTRENDISFTVNKLLKITDLLQDLNHLDKYHISILVLAALDHFASAYCFLFSFIMTTNYWLLTKSSRFNKIPPDYEPVGNRLVVVEVHWKDIAIKVYYHVVLQQ